MRILALDASPISGGTVSDAVEAAARAAADTGAQIVRVRLYDRYVRGEIRAVADELLACDALVIGAPAYFGRSNAATAALLRALTRIRRTRPPRRVPAVAVLVTSAGGQNALAMALSSATGPLPRLRQAFGALGVRTCGSLVVPVAWPTLTERGAFLPRAARLGDRLVASVPLTPAEQIMAMPRFRRTVPLAAEV